MARTGAFIPGTPTHASPPAGGQRAATPACTHAATVSRKAGSRAVKYCAP